MDCVPSPTPDRPNEIEQTDEVPTGGRTSEEEEEEEEASVSEISLVLRCCGAGKHTPSYSHTNGPLSHTLH